MTVEFRLLGDFEVMLHGKPVDVGHRRQQGVLVAMVVDANRVVSVDQLLYRVWGDELPHRGRETLYSYVSRLRKALAPATGVSIVWQAGGYVLAVDEMAVDLFRFRRGVAKARTGQDRARVALLDEALALWRDEPLRGWDTAWTDSLRRTVQRERLVAEADRTDVALRLEMHNEELVELPARAAQRPLDERVAGQYMLALFRAGRQAEALRHYRLLRARLAEDVGTEPSEEVRALHQAILANDPMLTGTVSHFGRDQVPRQLPASPWSFTGRARELAQLDQVPAGQVATISGAGGVGKTWLALRWAHQAIDRFPDGQLYVDLHGFDPAAAPVAASVVVRGFLEALGVGPAAMPADPDAQFGFYRSLVSRRRMLIVLDNARDSSQVLPFVPGAGSSRVLATSRRQLTTVAANHSTHAVALDMLTRAEAEDMLVRRLGPDRLAGAPGAVAELLDHCAGLPLALGVVATRAGARPDLPLASFAEDLSDTATRLDAFDNGELNGTLRAVLSCSYDALPAVEAETLGLIGVAPGPDISLCAAAHLIDLPESRTRIVLRRLSEASLVHQHKPNRYRLHDLVRLCVAERVKNSVPGLRRLVAYYADAAELQLDPPLAAALDWFDTEHSCLLAARELAVCQGWHEYVWRLACSLATFHRRRGHREVDVDSPHRI
ncbi:AfsR/SARP family transcriptional regulator [Actinocrispum wychmicini]|uniref:DNA-binding SARP family transcriptional activator n=1 Tax=Actinocrispum wychmicini TaxID=1213861 RepID=A0A4R2J3L9_9PSEU|nr:AfsR/SARP family transcriptional regulator [Actinocrispum wychmicini]TCO52614.1 DNA-binding SARP family transcriptional activator [Actinocrispum wychmicini]